MAFFCAAWPRLERKGIIGSYSLGSGKSVTLEEFDGNNTHKSDHELGCHVLENFGDSLVRSADLCISG